MSDLVQHSLEIIDGLEGFIQTWSETKPQEPSAEDFQTLLLEFDLSIVQLCELAENANDQELLLVFSHLQEILEPLQGSIPSFEQTELLCAWPLYISEFISNREDSEVHETIANYLDHNNWFKKNTEAEVIEDLFIESEGIPEEKPEETIVADAYESGIRDSKIDLQAFSSEQLEFLDLFNAELSEIQETHSEELAVLNEAEPSLSTLNNVLDTQADEIERIGSAAEMVGLQGLQKFAQHMHKIFMHIKETDVKKIVPLHEQLLIWPDVVQGHLIALDDSEYFQACIEYLNQDCWPIKLSEQELNAIVEAFNNSYIEVDNQQQEERLREATPENISLAVPEDVPQELVDSLLVDLPQQTSEFSTSIQNLTTNEFIEEIETAKRIAHTLKGAGNTVGIKGLANLTHNLEDILEALLKAAQKPNDALLNTLVDAADCLEEMSEYLMGVGNEPMQALEVFQQILDWANRIDEHGIPESDSETVDELLLNTSVQSRPQIDENIKPAEGPNREANVEASLRVASHLIDEILNQAGENIISNAQIQESISQSKEIARNLRSNNNRIKTLIQELEHMIEIKGFSSRFGSNNSNGKFDPLEMDEFNELHTFTNQLIEASDDSNEFLNNIEETVSKLEKLSNSQSRTLVQTQDAVLRTRMVPVKTIESRLNRSVRQACKLLNKQTHLEIIGGETLLDSEILNRLVDPLMHMLRNSIDHGIEQTERRLKNAKDPEGNIKLSFKKEGKTIQVTCEDDGRGLDTDRIKQTAIERGLLNESGEFSQQDAIKLILQHGFSTKDNVSQLSGRGVGLDVVFDNIREMKGTINLDSIPGKGLKIELSIPTTFHSTHALLISSGEQTLAISNHGIEEILYPGAGTVILENDQLMFQHQQFIYPLIDLQSILFENAEDKIDVQRQTALIVQDELNNKSAVLVDRVLENREIVIKPFSRFIPKITGLLGTTVLGDGGITTVVNLLDIINMSSQDAVKRSILGNRPKETDQRQHALIVEDAISTRKSLAQFMQDLGFAVQTAIDGVDAIDKVQQQVPHIILTDLEMPRMNGLELTDHLRSNPDTAETPIIMITSRSTDKHKQEALKIGVSEYMTKPFDEDKLLNLVNSFSITV